MNEDDRLEFDDVAAVRRGVRRMYRWSIFAAIAGSFLFSLLCSSFMYFVPSDHDLGTALVIGALVFIFWVGSLALHWWKHYNSIFKEIDTICQRIQAGEAVYGSQVSFR